MKRLLFFPVEKLVAYARQQLGQTAELVNIEISQLSGGYSSDQIYHCDLAFRTQDGRCQALPMVLKYTTDCEVLVTAQLSRVPEAEAVPRVIASAIHPATSEQRLASWFITPFYTGRVLTFDDAVPPSVVWTLVRIHAYFTSRVPDLEGAVRLARVDGIFFRGVFERALESLKQLIGRQELPGLAESYKRLEDANYSGIFEAALESQPLTLTNGDVHPGNIIQSPEGQSVLIDWGNARLAPAMLDLANLVEIDSPNWSLYLAAWEQVTGQALDAFLARQGYFWAVAMVNLQYLPFASTHWVENVPRMANKVLAAQDDLEKLSASII